ncbi:hypothetical protein [Methylocystis parvus]|uniref:hypothetical protein n=1 Tax=Methylocystis parvus TaxID=134 RepID=UPI003C76F623
MGSARSWLRLLGAALGAVGLGLASGVAQAQTGATASCGSSGLIKPVPTMTLQIFNNAKNFNIYPVLSTGTATQDAWLQAFCNIKKADYPKFPYPKTARQYRLYFNPVRGVRPGESITLTLPLLSQLETNPDPKKEDQYIDWWGGGRVEIFRLRKDFGQPPAALTANYNRNLAAQTKQPIKGSPQPVMTCADANKAPIACDDLKIVSDPAGLKDNEPSQLTEYTLGALKQNKDPVELVTTNIDVDVSYVDTAFMPAAIEPYGNPDVGYVGTLAPVGPFKDQITKFLAETDPRIKGWPQFIDNQRALIAKVPSTMRLMHGLTSDIPSPDLPPPPWAPIQRLVDNWNSCLPTANTPICNDINAIRAMFSANYANYAQKYGAAGSPCDQTKPKTVLDEKEMRAHVYGWTPFTENCPVDFNLLEKTPGYAANYQTLKDKFDELQLNLDFNPYTWLIHTYLGIKNAYAYSVDDAVGNLQADGTGFIIAVGGVGGLPNPNPAQFPVNVNIGYAKTDDPRFEAYGVFCGNDPSKDNPQKIIDPDYPSFPLYPTAYPTCRIVLRDNHGVIYKTFLKEPHYPPKPPANQPIPADNKVAVDCSLNTAPIAVQWCKDNFAYMEPNAKHELRYFVLSSLPQPPKPPPPPGSGGQ